MDGNKDSGLTTRGSSAFATSPAKRSIRILWSRLRIEGNDGSCAVEYRIENGRVESRILHAPAAARDTADMQWQLLTPEQLTAHVLSSTALGYWLTRRMGAHALVRACHQRSSATNGVAQRRSRSREEMVIGEFSPLLAKTSDSSTDGLFNT